MVQWIAFAAQVVNILTGNDSSEPVIELHFPFFNFLFEQEAMIAVGGADFSATIDGEDIPPLATRDHSKEQHIAI